MVLQQVGNVKYIGWSITVPCSPELILELRKLHSLMQTELEDWKKAVRDARRKHYELNYFTTPQLLSLRQDLGCLTSSSSIDLQVVALLRSISPHISMQSIRLAVEREVGKAVASRQETEPQQQVIGSLQTAMNENKSATQSMPSPPKRQARKKGKKQKYAKAVQQDTSVQTSEKITPEEMKQKKILANIVGTYGKRYKSLVLKAFKEGMDDQIEIENWVIDNEDQILPSESDQGGEDEDTSSEEEEEEEKRASSVLLADEPEQRSDNSSILQTGNTFIWYLEFSLCYSTLCYFAAKEHQRSIPLEEPHMITKEAVDVSHPAVQELIDAGYSEEQSITAIEKWETPEVAVDYLIATQTKNSDLEPVVRSEIDGETDEQSKTLQYVFNEI